MLQLQLQLQLLEPLETRSAQDAMQCAARGLVAVAGAGGAMLLTMVFSVGGYHVLATFAAFGGAHNE
jgi:hypothetical protein